MKFGDNLRKIRKSKKMSQEQLAEKMNVTRQSVSKWENGESYPEMNNIFELCKVFNCKLNDLVYPNMKDISSLDEEIVMNVVKFNEKKQKEVKTLSNVISIIGKIGSIVLKVAIPFIIIAMLIVPYIVSNLKVISFSLTSKLLTIYGTISIAIIINGIATFNTIEPIFPIIEITLLSVFTSFCFFSLNLTTFITISSSNEDISLISG